MATQTGTKKTTGKDVATKEEKDNPLAAAGMFEQDDHGGFEEADKDSYAIPFIQILQKMSPQVDEADGRYIEGAKPGQLINTVTEDLYDGKDGILVVPCYYRHVFVEFVTRDEGGGFVAEHGKAEGEELLKTCSRDDKNKEILPNGNQLVDARMHYVLLIHEDGTYEPALLSLSSTQLKKSRKWMSMMQRIKMKRSDGSLFTPPMFSHYYRLRTIPEQNEKGSWHGLSIENAGQLDREDLYQAAKDFKDAITAGKAKAAHDAAEAAGTAQDEDEPSF